MSRAANRTRRQNADSTEKVSAAMREQASTASGMTSSAQELTNLATDLLYAAVDPRIKYD